MQAPPDAAALWITVPSIVMGLYIGSAWAPLRRPPGGQRPYTHWADAKDAADKATDFQIWQRLRRRKGRRYVTARSSEDFWSQLFVAFLVTVGIVKLYSTHAVVVANVLLVAAGALLIASLVAIVSLKARDVVTGQMIACYLLCGLVFSVLGLFVSVWLVHPAVGGEHLRQLLAGIASGDMFRQGFGPLMYALGQLVAAVSFFAVAVAFMAISIALVTATYLEWQAFGRPLHLGLYWLTRWSVRRGSSS